MKEYDLYFLNLPEVGHYQAKEIVPVLKNTLDREDFQTLSEALYLKTPYAQGSLFVMSMDIQNSRDNIDTEPTPLVLREGSSENRLHETQKYIADYISRNGGNFKLVTLYHENGSEEQPERDLLEQSVRLHSDRLHQESFQDPFNINLQEIFLS